MNLCEIERNNPQPIFDLILYKYFIDLYSFTATAMCFLFYIFVWCVTFWNSEKQIFIMH